MSDGTVLRADVHRPDAPGRFPVLVTQTPYNKGGPLRGAIPYLVERGYVHVVVDVRGTGSSEGQWDSVGPNERRDGKEMIEWAARAAVERREGRHGRPVLHGQHADRDGGAAAEGAQGDVHRRPDGRRLPRHHVLRRPDEHRVHPAVARPRHRREHRPRRRTPRRPAGHRPQPHDAAPARDAGSAASRSSTVANATTGGDNAYDGPFWKTRSPIEDVDRIAGARLRRRRPARPLPARVAAALRAAQGQRRVAAAHGPVEPPLRLGRPTASPTTALPSLEQIQLRWFDHYLKGIDTRVSRRSRGSRSTRGASSKYEAQPDWPHPRLDPSKLYLRAGNALSADAPAGDEAPETFVQNPASGICTQSTSQWTAGALEPLPCTTDDRLNEAGEVTYTTPPLESDLRLNGPILANLWLKTTASDAVASVRVTDVGAGRHVDRADRRLARRLLPRRRRAQEPPRPRRAAAALAPVHARVRAAGEGRGADGARGRGLPHQRGDQEGPRAAGRGRRRRLPALDAAGCRSSRTSWAASSRSSTTRSTRPRSRCRRSARAARCRCPRRRRRRSRRRRSGKARRAKGKSRRAKAKAKRRAGRSAQARDGQAEARAGPRPKLVVDGCLPLPVPDLIRG